MGRGCTHLGFKQTHLKLKERTNYRNHRIFLYKKKKKRVKTNKTPSCPAALLYKTAATNENIQKHANQHAAHQAVECLHPNASSVLPLAP